MQEKEIKEMMETLRKKVSIYVDAITEAMRKTEHEMRHDTLTRRDLSDRREEVASQKIELGTLLFNALNQPDVVKKHGEELMLLAELFFGGLF